MKATSVMCRAPHALSWLLSATLLLSVSSPAPAQTNSWVAPINGKWENAASWSLGITPGPNQDVFVTNAEIVIIDPLTVQSEPQSLSVKSLTLSTGDQVVMDRAGLGTPLTIGLTNEGSLNSGANTSVVILSSALVVNGGINAGGTFIESGNSLVGGESLDVGGTFSLTNGTLAINGNETIGTMNQLGGTNTGAQLLVGNGGVSGQYNMSGGYLAGAVTISGLGKFIQTGGQFLGSVAYGYYGGSFQFSGGTISQGNLDVQGGQGGYMSYAWGDAFTQTGGATYVTNLNVGTTGYGQFTLSGGLLDSSNLNIGPPLQLHYENGSGGPTFFTQNGGVHSNGMINMSGALEPGMNNSVASTRIILAPNDGVRYGLADYNLNGGVLYSSNINLSLASFIQSAGTNYTTNILGDTYLLNGGLLVAENIQNGVFSQSAGTNFVDNLSSVNYTMTGGNLEAQNIWVVGESTFVHTAGNCRVDGLFIIGSGVWQEKTNGAQLGRLVLGEKPGTIQLPTNACVLKFGDSSGLTWSNGVLTIQNWNGLLTGGGTNQLLFGDSNALTAAQLTQIQFADPAGLASGTYSAKLLASGELVPTGSLVVTAPAPFFTDEHSLGNNWYYLSTSSNNIFGYYNTTNFPYIYHLDMGWEYFIDANNAGQGAYFYDFADSVWFYTQPDEFPYVYDFNAGAWIYYQPDATQHGRYTSSPRWFFNFSTQTWTNHL